MGTSATTVCPAVSTGLDPVSLDLIARLIRRLDDAPGISSMAAIHGMNESDRVADDSCFIDGGVVVVGGPVQEMRPGEGAAALDVSGRFFP